MDKIGIEIGRRLREIRVNIFNEGVKLSASQFAQLLNVSQDKIRNYENGRSGVPPELLVKLYRKGINPVFILTGEESIFAANRAGKILKERLEESEVFHNDKVIPIGSASLDTKKMSMDEKLELISAVAGDILNQRKKNDD